MADTENVVYHVHAAAKTLYTTDDLPQWNKATARQTRFPVSVVAFYLMLPKRYKIHLIHLANWC